VRELLLGITLGFGAAVSPGPLLALVITVSLRHGVRAGMQVAASPIVTDLVIIVTTTTVLGAAPERVLAGAGVIGAGVVATLGVNAWRSARHARLPQPGESDRSRPLWKGALVNLLSPHPWLFWLSVGGPLLVAASHRGPAPVGAFLIGFYGLLVGTKATLAALLAASRHRLSLPWYRRLLRLSSGLLVVAALALGIEFAPALFP
jgi:threonine/homoserine/homoserine lactone efflux protein